MSFKDYIKENDNEVMALLNQINRVQEEFITSYKSLQNLKLLASNPTVSQILGNINYNNQIDKIELRMNELGKMLSDLQNLVTGGRIVSNQMGSWGGPD